MVAENINIAFSFDKNYIAPAKTVIGSLLDSSAVKDVHYNIYLICPDEVKPYEENITNFIEKKDQTSSVQFCYHNKIFTNGFEVRGISTAAYYRLLLHKFLPNVDKIIYSDVDIIYRKDLQNAWMFDMGENVIAGVKGLAMNISEKWNSLIKNFPDRKEEFFGLQGKYINSGFLVLDLKKIRNLNIDDNKFIKMSQKHYEYQDQDIINLVYRNKIAFLPLEYNFITYTSDKDYEQAIAENIITKHEIDIAQNSPVTVHYAGEKPWNSQYVNKANYFINYIKQNPELLKDFNITKLCIYRNLFFLKLARLFPMFRKNTQKQYDKVKYYLSILKERE